MSKLQLVILALGTLLFVWFMAPLFMKGLFNLGTATGMAVSVILILYGIFQRRIHLFVMHLKENKVGNVFVWVLGLLVVALVITVVAETILMAKSAMHKPPENTTAVVLGCSVKGSKPSRILAERLDAAYEYLTENEQAACILSGGQGEGEDISEAECMYQYLINRGIDASRLIKEDTSRNTQENLANSMKLLNQHGLGENITIITSEFHEYRANAMAKKLGLNSYSTPSHTFFLYFPTYYVRELYGILYYMVRK